MANQGNLDNLHKQGLELFGNKQYEEAFRVWKHAADLGSAKAMCDVGWLYSQGNGTNVDEQKAFHYMLRSAQLGYVRAQNNVGLYYKKGTGTAADIRQAVFWLDKAEKAKYPKLAENTLLTCRAMLREQDAAEQHAAGMKAFAKKDNHAAFGLWQNSAQAGHAEAMCDLGWMYSQGLGTEKDDRSAFDWMLRSAEKGCTRAQNNVGLYFRNGTGTPMDLKKAVFWLSKAEEQNYPKLARKTLSEARELLAETSEREYLSGLALFGEKKYQEAAKKWLDAAEMGSAKAMCDLGWMHSQGHGVEKDDVKAFDWMLKSACHGYARAQNNVGLYYKNGVGVQKDIVKAVEWLEKAEQANYDKLAKKALKEARSMLRMDGASGLEKSNSSGTARSSHRSEDSAKGPDKNECVVCLDAVADHCILFCMHNCLCQECAVRFVDANGKGKGICPKCRAPVEMVKKIF